MSDLDIIREIEKEIGRKLEKLPYYDPMTRSDIGFNADNSGNITHLILESIELNEIPSAIIKLIKLKKLSVYDNQLTQIPKGISKLTCLESLILERNRLAKLPEEIGRLGNLNYLLLGYNQFSEIPRGIIELKSLVVLRFNGNKLTQLPKAISNLEDLKELDLGDNQLTEFPEAIVELKNLEDLSLSGNQLIKLPERIRELKSLKFLCLWRNQLSELTDEIGELKNIEHLDLGSNRLLHLPEAIGELKNLKNLYLGSNQLTTIPSTTGELKELQNLFLGSNHLIQLPKIKGELKNLLYLDLSNNELIQLPEWVLRTGLEIEWFHDSDHPRIFLKGNPIEPPPYEIESKGINAVIKWYDALKVGIKRPLDEVKVLIVGEGGAGKTCLVKRLLKQSFNPSEHKTDGINIDRRKIECGDKSIMAHFWDFGGQEIMHATHQFFLSNRSLYVLVLDGRKDERPENWLKHIESFGGDSPILIVMNKIDENPGYELNRKDLLMKFKSIKGFYRISCKTSKGLSNFIEGLKNALKKVEILHTIWPDSWFKVKVVLENLKENFITLDKYQEICRKSGIEENTSMETLVDFLNDLGVVLHFSDFKLLDMHVLEPEWITGAVYRIINSRTLVECDGAFDLEMLDKIFNHRNNWLNKLIQKTYRYNYEYHPKHYQFIIDTMKKFELCYSLNRNKVFVPDLLSKEEPSYDFDYDNCLRFVIGYEFLPRSILPRFIVRQHSEIKDKLQWRTGVVLEDDTYNSKAVIKADYEEKKIEIFINGKQINEYFNIILHEFRRINRSFKKLDVSERIPLPDNPNISVSFEHLRWLESESVTKFYPEGAKKMYYVPDLLGKVYVPIENEKEIMELLSKLIKRFDTEESLLDIANSIFMIQPNFMGLGINLNEAIKRIFSRKTKLLKPKSEQN